MKGNSLRDFRILMGIGLNHVTFANIQLFLTGKNGNVIWFKELMSLVVLDHLIFSEVSCVAEVVDERFCFKKL